MTGVAFSADGSRMITVAQDQSIRLWDMADQSVIAEAEVLNGQQSGVFTLNGEATQFATVGSEENVIRVWETTASE